MSIVKTPEFSIFRSIIEKDLLTAQHCIHVAYMFSNSVSALGHKINKQQAYYAGLLHDLGKINAPDVIFSNKSPLSSEEYNLVKKHPVDSFELLKAANLPKNICEIALLHHEREDGSGYPFGIRYNEIPPEVKLIAIVDSLCAIVESRAYRNPVSLRKAIDLLYESSQKYDREMLNEFISNLKSIYKVTLSEMYREYITIESEEKPKNSVDINFAKIMSILKRT